MGLGLALVRYCWIEKQSAMRDNKPEGPMVKQWIAEKSCIIIDRETAYWRAYLKLTAPALHLPGAGLIDQNALPPGA